MDTLNINKILNQARIGIEDYLNTAYRLGNIDEQLFAIARNNCYSNFVRWFCDENINIISPNFRIGIIEAINKGKWEQIVNAFRQYLSFGTGGIRGMMAYDKASIERIKLEGIDAPIVKGPNTINNILLLLTSAGVAKYGIDNGLKKIVIGYDSRIKGFEFAKLVAELFLGYGYIVYLFDSPCPYPEVTFAIPNHLIKADFGILISASHNDYRYNGYKLSCCNGSQFDANERDIIYNQYITVLLNNSDFSKSTSEIMKRLTLSEAGPDQLWYLGGEKLLEGFDYGKSRGNLINIHEEHRNHVNSFIINKDLVTNQSKSDQSINIAYCAFHGAGYIAVPRLLNESGFNLPYSITKNSLNTLDGMFPSFSNEAGKERQPDPGDPRAAKVAVDSFMEEFPNPDVPVNFKDIDILIGTDPDADRCGIVVQVPQEQRFLYKNERTGTTPAWCLMPADDIWALILWYRLTQGQKYADTLYSENDKKFIVLSHTTSDSMVKLAQKFNVGVVKTWVGFAMLAAATQDLWKPDDSAYNSYLSIVEGLRPGNANLSHPVVYKTYGLDKHRRNINIAAMEQSNGFSILGAPPVNNCSLGVDGHVRDKDGIFAALLVSEAAAYAKKLGTTLFNLIDEKIYLDPEIGLFVNGYEADPTDGEYPGITGDRIKKNILRRALSMFYQAQAGDLEIAGEKVRSSHIYRTGKYDHVYPPTLDFQFPDEGIRFYFDKEKLNHVTIRPSGTGNSLRFHTQLHVMINDNNLNLDNSENRRMLLDKLILKKDELRRKTKQIFDDIRIQLKAPRQEE
jgi:phosphomannomutase